MLYLLVHRVSISFEIKMDCFNFLQNLKEIDSIALWNIFFYNFIISIYITCIFSSEDLVLYFKKDIKKPFFIKKILIAIYLKLNHSGVIQKIFIVRNAENSEFKNLVLKLITIKGTCVLDHLGSILFNAYTGTFLNTLSHSHMYMHVNKVLLC